ncbi:MAG: glycosyl transferase family 1 [Candidatus Brocadia sp.]|nr:D-inositol-3-phosphate glycosyltransferase [Anaerolineales bacterium]RIJ90077.1 MAG: glycosyl transferase family 1 [Candidatus Brocadia sp.]
MKILICHNYYRSSAPSGEDAVFRNERELLKERGVEVILFERFNDDIDDSTLNKRLQVALNGTWSRQTYNELSDMIRKTRPDVAHFHNTFPQISPSAYAACQDNSVPVVQTLHNYRLICPSALLMRNAHPCEDCVGTTLLPALRHRCYRDSLFATGALVWMLVQNRWRGTYKTLVNRYIALTRFAAVKLVEGGLPESRIETKPNFLQNMPNAGNGGGGYAVYVGRLSKEKGVQTLIEAWKQIIGFPLKVLGDGPLRTELEEQVQQQGMQVEFLGFRTREEIFKIVSNAELQIIPSEWYEGFPMVVLEAYACGTPVVASRIGSLDEIILEGKTGVKFEPGNSKDLANKVLKLYTDKSRLNIMRLKARALFDEKYTADKNYFKLMEIYHNAIDDFNENRK